MLDLLKTFSWQELRQHPWRNAAAVVAVTLAGSVRASGAALAVMDIGAAQDLFGKQGLLSRIDLRLQAGVNRDDFARQLQAQPDWPVGVTVAQPGDAQSQLNNLSQAYRVNLTVLALSVAKRAQQFALLGVLGLSGRDRLKLVLWESAALGVVGSLCGLALGAGLAALALNLLGGDLGADFLPVQHRHCNSTAGLQRCMAHWGWRPRWQVAGGQRARRSGCQQPRRSRVWGTLKPRTAFGGRSSRGLPKLQPDGVAAAAVDDH